MKASSERKTKECGRGRRKSCGKKEIRGRGEGNQEGHLVFYFRNKLKSLIFQFVNYKKREIQNRFCLGINTKSVLKSLKWSWNLISF